MNVLERLTSHVKLGYRDDSSSEWKELHKSYNLSRLFRCQESLSDEVYLDFFKILFICEG